MSTSSHVLSSILSHLATCSVTPLKQLEHEPSGTSADSARVRGEPIEHGAKALLIKLDEGFALFVLSAARQFDSGAVKKRLGTKKNRFASREELLELTGLVPGSVPPFGRPVLPFDLYVDESIPPLPRVAFNAGSLTDSLILETKDYLRAAEPKAIFAFSAVAASPGAAGSPAPV